MNTKDITNGNLAALLAQIVPPADEDRIPTGEPCRCHPDRELPCNCGAYQGVA